MRHETLSSVRDVPADAWREVRAQSDADAVFASPAWLGPWLDTLGADYDSLIHTVYEGDELIAVLPLIRRKKEGFRQLALAGVHASDTLDFAVRPGCVDAVARYLVDTILPATPDWDLFHCTRFVRGRSSGQALTAALAQSRYRYDERPFDVAPYVAIEGAFDEYLSRHVRKKLVKDSERQLRRIERDVGPITYERAKTAADIDRWMPTLARLHRVRREDDKGDYSMFSDDMTRTFYTRVAHEMLAEGVLDFTALLVDGEVAALHFGFATPERFYYTLPVFDLAYGKYSIGRLLMLELMRRSFEAGRAVFDFGYGDEAYKYEFTETKDTLDELVVGNDTLRGGIAMTWFKGIRQKIKSSDAFMAHVLPRLKQGGLVTEGS
ncbi:MAG: GNAT family N-acetyltransferase [Bacteroidota bacterium]